MQKLLDFDSVRQQKLKIEDKQISQEDKKTAHEEKNTVLSKLKNNKTKTNQTQNKKLKNFTSLQNNASTSQVKLIANIGTKEDKHLELNTSFERDYVGSAHWQMSESLYINFKDYEGRTALHAAALKKNYEVVKIFIYNNCSLFVRDLKLKVCY